MKNKKLFLLSLFLLFPATTQCMKRSHSDIVVHDSLSFTVPKTKTIKNLRCKRDQLYNRIKTNPINLYSSIVINAIAWQSFYRNEYGYILSNCKKESLLTAYKTTYIDQYSISGKITGKYSLLGVATMTVKNDISYKKIPYSEKKIY